MRRGSIRMHYADEFSVVSIVGLPCLKQPASVGCVDTQEQAQRTQRHLEAAVGYMELGMFQEANDEIEKSPFQMKDSKAVLTVRAFIYHETGSWQLLLEVGDFLTRTWPEEIEHWICLAYGTRMCHSVLEAEEILLAALMHHGTSAKIHLHLALYAAQLRRFDTARERVKQALALDPGIRQAVLDHPDLELIWKGL